MNYSSLTIPGRYVACINDTHFGARNDGVIFHNAFRDFYSNMFFPHLVANKIHTIIHLGDIFDRRKYINFQSLDACTKYFFEQAAKHNINVWIIVGNHDSFFSSTIEINSPRLLLAGKYSNVVIIDQPEIHTFGKSAIGLVPWICPANQTHIMQFIGEQKTNILFGHFEFRGYQMYKGVVQEYGADPTIVQNYDIVASGHYHHKSSKHNIHYLGAPYEMNWSDYDDPRGFNIFDTTTQQFEHIVNPNKIFAKFFYDDSSEQNLADLHKYANKFVKVIVREKSDLMQFDSFIDSMEKVGVADLQVVEDHLHLDTMTEVDIDQTQDTLSIIENEVEQLDTYVSKSDIKALARKLYANALEIA